MLRPLTLSVTYLILLITLKIKVLWGYKFLWPSVFLVTKPFIPEWTECLNPSFYFDDVFVAFLFFTLYFCLFKKNSAKINIFLYILYLLICVYSILSSIIFYKYGVPLSSSIVYQIDSLYTMRTSIDTELKENYRIIISSLSLLSFSIIFPIILNYMYKLIKKQNNNRNVPKIIISRITSMLIIISIVFTIKTYYFGSKILTESPLTTLSKSIAISLYTRMFSDKTNIPEFDDRILNSFTNTSQNKPVEFINNRRNYNVILVILETTNAQFFNPASHSARYLPHLTKLAEEGLYLSHFYTPFPRSSKAFFAILTGYYPLTSYRSLLKTSPDISVPSIFSILKLYRYNTFAGYSGDFNYDRMSDFLVNRGVDQLVDINANDGTYDQISWGADDALIYDSLMAWLDSVDRDTPFFALLLPMNTHHPFWTPKEKYKVVPEHDQQGRYINAIHYQDHLIGKLINFLKTTNRWNNTVILITGDHGAVFNVLKSESTNASPYLIDKNTINVPFYLYSPNIKSKKIQYDFVASHIDILPTILDILGVVNGEQFQGRSIFDPAIKKRISFVYNDYCHHIVIGLTKNWNLMRDFSDHTTILSKNFDFNTNECNDEEQICESLLKKVLEFNRFQDRRLLRLCK